MVPGMNFKTKNAKKIHAWHHLFMNRAIQLAMMGKGMTSPNPVVGALIIKKGKVVAEGYHKKAGDDHAEVMALKKAGIRAKGAILYVTLEPCFHHGKTPPCCHAIKEAGIKEVVIGIKDPNPATNGKSIRWLRNKGVKVTVGVLKDEINILNEVFIKNMTKKLPFVVSKSAQTLDGKIATSIGSSKWITSEKTRKFTRVIRSDFDAILVGVNTVLCDDPELNGTGSKKHLKKIIVDSSLKTPLKAKLFKGMPKGFCYVATTQKASRRKITELKKIGANVIICPDKKGKVDLFWLFKYLAKDEMRSILLEGGSKIIGSALKAGLVDKMNIYIAPKVVGDQKALSSIDGLATKKISQVLELDRLTVKMIEKEVFITGYVLRNR